MKTVKKVESIFIEIDNGKNKNVIIGCIYNPPGNNIQKFNEYIYNIWFQGRLLN